MGCFGSRHRTHLDTPYGANVTGYAFSPPQSASGSAGMSYSVPSGSSGGNFGWFDTGSGYEARFRATMADGQVVGHDSAPVPYDMYGNIGPPSFRQVNNTYTANFAPHGQDLRPYFN